MQPTVGDGQPKCSARNIFDSARLSHCSARNISTDAKKIAFVHFSPNLKPSSPTVSRHSGTGSATEFMRPPQAKKGGPVSGDESSPDTLELRSGTCAIKRNPI
jgi:hypothetical protein